MKEGVIADLYAQLSNREESISRLQTENDRMGHLLKQSEMRADGFMVELSELKLSESKIRQHYNQEIEELQQRIIALNSRSMEYEEQVASGRPDGFHMVRINELEEQLVRYREHNSRLEQQLSLKTG